MEIHKKYLEALKAFTEFVTLREWAVKFSEMYPDDFKEIDEKAKKYKSNGLRELTNRMDKSLKKEEMFSFIKIDYSSSLKKVKYSKNIKKKDLEEKKELAEYNKKDKKFLQCEEMSNELESFQAEYSDITNDLPKRDESKYIKKIESIDIFEFSSCIMLEMAHRNKDVIDIINKIEYIQDLMRNPIVKEIENLNEFLKKNSEITSSVNSNTNKLINEWEKSLNENIKLLTGKSGEECEEYKQKLGKSEFFKKDSEELIRLRTLDYFRDKSFISPNILKNEYRFILKLSLDEFKKELEFFEDRPNVVEFFVKNKISDENTQLLHKLATIMELLQSKLKIEFFIYPNKYYKDANNDCNNNVICKNYFRKLPNTQKALKILNKSFVQNSLNEFRKLKPTEMEAVSDIFFIYDYNKKTLNNDQISIAKNIKYALTIFHGVEIGENKKTKKNIETRKTIERMNYNDFLEEYYEFDENKLAGFYCTERNINEKIKLMKNFIEKKYFKYIIFN